MLMYMLYYLFLMGMVSFLINRKHFLLMLLSLEFMVISIYLIMFIYLQMFKFEFFFSMIFLVITVCESVLGLSIMVLMVRMYGNDYIMSFYILW
uniref:NADH-ubiquinone oxidoreductase chain 4L n=1 Tax=Omophoita sp. REN-2018 TaxID=2506509 RepID=A0A411D9Y4_9CUCU|nr:NADH dehydrogenase subunit 4L [Omophoita sp. REN-2018]